MNGAGEERGREYRDRPVMARRDLTTMKKKEKQRRTETIDRDPDEEGEEASALHDWGRCKTPIRSSPMVE